MEDLERPISLAAELYVYASKEKNVDDYKYFVEELNKISPENQHKFFYNIAKTITPHLQANPLVKPVCKKCSSDEIEYVKK